VRRKPEEQQKGAHSFGVSPEQPLTPRVATDRGSDIEPFLVSGGAVSFIVSVNPAFDPRPDGVQLVRSLYVPSGRTGFLKQLRVAPFMPPIFVDPWETSGLTNASWRVFGGGVGAPTRPGGRNGVWETPFGWEGYFDPAVQGALAPEWTWQLRFIRGDIARLRSRRPPFSVADPSSWYLVENIAVPAVAYVSGIPGAAPAGAWTPERMQVLQGDELSSHVVIPQDTTLCLFARWKQQATQPRGVLQTGEGLSAQSYGQTEFPLLPSFGQLHGYMQAADREASSENALYGWGG